MELSDALYFAREHSGLTGTHFRVYEQYVLAAKTGEAWPSKTRIAERLSLCRKTITRVTKTLEEEGFLRTVGHQKMRGKLGSTKRYSFPRYAAWLAEQSNVPQAEECPTSTKDEMSHKQCPQMSHKHPAMSHKQMSHKNIYIDSNSLALKKEPLENQEDTFSRESVCNESVDTSVEHIQTQGAPFGSNEWKFEVLRAAFIDR